MQERYNSCRDGQGHDTWGTPKLSNLNLFIIRKIFPGRVYAAKHRQQFVDIHSLREYSCFLLCFSSKFGRSWFR